MTRFTNGSCREIFNGTSATALGVAAHQCGHAIQHKQAYARSRWRMAAVGLTMFASQIVLWLPLLGMLTGFLTTGLALTLVAGAWGILMLFNLITLSGRVRRLRKGATGAKGPGLSGRQKKTPPSCEYHGRQPGPMLPHSSPLSLTSLALIASLGWPQPITDAPGENITARSTYI